MTEEKEDDIKKAAEKFFIEVVKPMFPSDVICTACGAQNCSCNKTCINCNCQM